jgi:hypothetical protein
MKNLAEKLKADGSTKGYLRRDGLVITYPGYKKNGDYRLSENGKAPKHEDIVTEIFNFTTGENFNSVTNFLDDVYANGLYAVSNVFSKDFKEKIFWITLQEEINYPQPQYAGRRLSFQRFYEAALAKKGICSLQEVIERTNNFGKQKPVLFKCDGIIHPSFYF